MNNRDLEIWVIDHCRSFKLVPFESFGAVSYSPFIVIMALSCIISEIVVENRDFAFDVPVRGSPTEYCHPVWYGKHWCILPDGEKL